MWFQNNKVAKSLFYNPIRCHTFDTTIVQFSESHFGGLFDEEEKFETKNWLRVIVVVVGFSIFGGIESMIFEQSYGLCDAKCQFILVKDVEGGISAIPMLTLPFYER